MKKRQSFIKGFKLEAVRLTESSNNPKNQIAEELGISDLTLYQWICTLERLLAG